MSTLEVNTITPQSGTTLTLGGSGDTINLGSGVTNNLGITEADSWRINSNFSLDNNTVYLTSNWERADYSGFEKIGTGLSESSGIFSFGTTGKYLLMYQAFGFTNVNANENLIFIDWTVDNFSNTIRISELGLGPSSADATEYGSATTTTIVDVTNTSTHKFKLAVSSTGNFTWSGHTTKTRTGVIAIRLGDT